jgi:hypothetical protein
VGEEGEDPGDGDGVEGYVCGGEEGGHCWFVCSVVVGWWLGGR